MIQGPSCGFDEALDDENLIEESHLEDDGNLVKEAHLEDDDNLVKAALTKPLKLLLV